MDQARECLQKGRQFQAAGDWPQAHQAFLAALQWAPCDAEICQAVVEAEVALGRSQEAIQTTLHLLDILERSDRWQRAEEVVNWLRERVAASDLLLSRSILIYRHLGQGHQAAEDARQLARLYFRMARADLGLATLEAGHKDDPDHLELGLELAEGLVASGEISRAQNLFRQVAHRALDRGQPDVAMKSFYLLDVLKG